jgi:uncharacterized protein (TIGR03663 family)
MAATRKRNPVQSKSAASQKPNVGQESAAVSIESRAKPQFWMIAGLILVLAVILRCAALSLKPLHNDEGVNGFFLQNLFLHNQYAYDPKNYHGPSLYYLTLPFIYLFGMSVPTLRAVPGLFGILTIWLILSLRNRIGTRAAIYAALLICVSPGAVFFSRYFIHETLVACFTLGIVMSAWDYTDKRKQSSLLWCAVSAGLLFATKETASIECAILAASAGCMVLWIRLMGGAQAEPIKSDNINPGISALSWVYAAAIFIGINFLLYSSMLTHYHGLTDALNSPRYWFARTGNVQVHPWWQYFSWLEVEDPVLLIIGLIGVVYALVTRANRFTVFTAFWTLGTLLVYSISGYKTPWIVLNMLVPMAILAGSLVASVPDKSYRGIIAATACAICLSTDYSLNLVHYDDDSRPYVYAQTQRGFFGLYNIIRRYSNLSGDNGQTAISIVSPDYWPLPWYLRQDNNVGYGGSLHPPSKDIRIIIANQNQEAQVNQMVGNSFVLQGRYALRPGVVLDVYMRNPK